jgi:phosphatidylinositol alpha-1,6-mannosyltransferase
MDNLGGMQRVAVDLHEALNAHEEMSVFDRIMRASWRWRYVHAARYLMGSYAAIPRLVNRHDIDVVLFTSMPTAAFALPLAGFFRKAGCKSVVITHGLDVIERISWYQRWVIPAVFRMVDAVAPVSMATGEACLERGLDEVKLHVIPNGVHADRFAHVKADKIGLLGRAGSLPDDALLLCSVGRHVRRKGFEWFVDQVMPKLADHIHYWLAGDGSITEDIRAAMRRNGLEKRIQLLGRITDAQVKALYEMADLFVMPNIPIAGDMEGFGVVLIEAGLCGLPAVASELEGIRDVIHEGANGYFAKPESIESFIEIINRLDLDRQALCKLANGTCSHTLDTFSWPAVADRFAHLFRQLIHHR